MLCLLLNLDLLQFAYYVAKSETNYKRFILFLNKRFINKLSHHLLIAYLLSHESLISC